MRKQLCLRALFLIILYTVFSTNQAALAENQFPQNRIAPVVTVRLEGALSPVMLEQLERAQDLAQREQAQAIIVSLDTPGGQINLMTQVIEAIRASTVPIVVYVSPRGAMAGSAGAIITLAGHLSAMAPETAIGAASPVGSSGEDIGETMQTKVKEMLKATAHSLMTNRSAGAVQLADDMIDHAKAVSVNEALQTGLIDYRAEDILDLLSQMDGKVIKVSGQSWTLQTQEARQIPVSQTFLENLLTLLVNPNIAFLLLAVGIQAILIELATPGGWIAGFIGVVCVLLASYGLGVLSVNWFGILFIVLAFVLFILDIKAPTHGALTVAGTATFILGSLILFNPADLPSVQRISIPLVVGVGISLGLIFFGLVGIGLRAQAAPVRIGTNTLIGRKGWVQSPIAPKGTVLLGSELWTAVSEDPTQSISTGTRVEVIALDRLNIRVKPVEETTPKPVSTNTGI